MKEKMKPLSYFQKMSWARVIRVQRMIKEGYTEEECAEAEKVSVRWIRRIKNKRVPADVYIQLEEAPDVQAFDDKEARHKLKVNMGPIEFVESADGLGFKLFPMQRLILKAFYGLVLEPAEKKLLETLKKAGKTTWREGEKYTELVLMVGMKGGKTELASAISLYEEYKLFGLDSPQKHYNLPKGKEIYIINVAADKEQAKDTIFASTKSRIDNSEFYKRRRYQETGRQFEFPNNVKIYSGHSNSASIVGRTAKLVIFDELARFMSSKTGKSSGYRVYNSLNRSVAPFGEEAKIVSLSSTLYEGDMIDYLYDKSKTINGMLGFRLATWEMNPNLPFDQPFLKRERDKCPEDFWRDYGIQPAKALEKYYRDRVKIEKAFYLGQVNGLIDPIDHDGTFKDFFRGSTEFNYHLHLDPAVNNCSFGIALAYRKGDLILVPLAHRFQSSENREIDFNSIQEFLELLIDRFPTTKTVTYDSYMAVSLYQAMEKKGLKAEFLSVQKKQHDDLKIEGIYKERVCLYPNRVLERELKDLDLMNGTKVDHPDDGSKDIADAVAGAVSKTLESKEVQVAIVATERKEEPQVQERFQGISMHRRPSIVQNTRRRSLIWG